MVKVQVEDNEGKHVMYDKIAIGFCGHVDINSAVEGISFLVCDSDIDDALLALAQLNTATISELAKGNKHDAVIMLNVMKNLGDKMLSDVLEQYNEKHGDGNE